MLVRSFIRYDIMNRPVLKEASHPDAMDDEPEDAAAAGAMDERPDE